MHQQEGMGMIYENRTKLSVWAFGLALGITKALFLLVIAWVALFSGYGMGMVHDVGTYFHGYAPTFLGGIFGAILGFICGFIFGVIFAWIYNLCACHGCRRKEVEITTTRTSDINRNINP
jgi:ABC-type multidrug transport system permease subunit